MKSIKIYLNVVFFSVLLINTVFANEIANTWYFYKVSKNTVLGESDFTRENLIDKYADTKIFLADKKLTVDGVCSFEYIDQLKTPLSHWMSEKTTKLYQSLFLQEGVPLRDKINVITYLYPNDQCAPPFNEFIKINDYLITVTEQGYLLLFSQKQNDKQLSSTYRGLHRDLNLLGHPMISNKSIVNKINKECDFPADGSYQCNDCDSTELGLYFGRLLERINQKKSYINKSNGYKYYVSKKVIGENETEVTLYTESNNKVIDKLMLYKDKTLESAAFSQYYYIDKQIKNIWLLNDVIDTETHYVEKWRHYETDNTGHFKLLESISCNYRDSKGIVKCQID